MTDDRLKDAVESLKRQDIALLRLLLAKVQEFLESQKKPLKSSKRAGNRSIGTIKAK